MLFFQVPLGPMGNFSYIIGEGSDAAVIDPGWDYKKLISVCLENKLVVRKILLTHGHFDHAQDLNMLAEKTSADVFVHALEGISPIIRNIHFIKDNDFIFLGKLKIQVIHTPGHTQGSVCYLFKNKLITGDTLFVGGIGRTDLPGSSQVDMEKSLKKLSLLDEKIEVWPGHDYGSRKHSTIGHEKRNNQFMNL